MLKIILAILLFSTNVFAYKGILEADKVRGLQSTPNWIKNGDFDVNITKYLTYSSVGTGTGASGSAISIAGAGSPYGKAARLTAQAGTALGNYRSTKLFFDIETVPFTTAPNHRICYISGMARGVTLPNLASYEANIVYAVDGTTIEKGFYLGVSNGYSQISFRVPCGTDTSSRNLYIEAYVYNQVAGTTRTLVVDFDEIQFGPINSSVIDTPFLVSPVITFFSASNTGVVSEANAQNIINADGVVSDTSLFTYTLITGKFLVNPNCWADLNDIDPGAADQKATVTVDSTTQIVVRTTSNGVKTALAHKVFCMGSM